MIMAKIGQLTKKTEQYMYYSVLACYIFDYHERILTIFGR